MNPETMEVTLVMNVVEFEAVHTALETFVKRNRSDESQQKWEDLCSTIRDLKFTFRNKDIE